MAIWAEPTISDYGSPDSTSNSSAGFQIVIRMARTQDVFDLSDIGKANLAVLATPTVRIPRKDSGPTKIASKHIKNGQD